MSLENESVNRFVCMVQYGYCCLVMHFDDEFVLFEDHLVLAFLVVTDK